MSIIPKHKVFISYYSEDEIFKERFESILGINYAVSRSVSDGSIEIKGKTVEYIMEQIRDKYLRDSSVTIVLIGKNTWRRKYVDWEIYASLRSTKSSPRSGLLGIILPSYYSSVQSRLDIHIIPPRLYDNVECKYAKIYNWTEDSIQLANYIHTAFSERNSTNPNNGRTRFGRNRPHKQTAWQ